MLQQKLSKIKVNYDTTKYNEQIWFTDGSCTNNGRKNSHGGYAAICVSGTAKGSCALGKLGPDSNGKAPTNIRAEAMAILYILEKINARESHEPTIIYTDSEFWIKMLYNYMPNWPESKFDKMANPDITKKMWRIFREVQARNKGELKLVHVYAHNKKNDRDSNDMHRRFCHDNNSAADIFANIARMSVPIGETREYNLLKSSPYDAE